MPEPPRNGEAVLNLIRRSEATDHTDLDAFLADHPLPDDPAEAANQLVAAGLLTPFQMRLLLKGKHKGFRVGPYRIRDTIGRGGMGHVVLGEHTVMRRRVAVKLLPGRLAADPAAVDRFYREARAVAALDHPNIVRAHDVGFDNGMHYLVLEYVPGENLEERLRRSGPVPSGEAAGFAVQAAAGLKHAHDCGLVHRDVKPANLLVDRDGMVKILDLGVARFFLDPDRRGRSSDPGRVMGTADYVAPEQLIDGALDRRADIYALGATLYHLAAGRPPFGGTTAAKLLGHQLQTAPPLHTVCRVPEGMAAVVSRMMEKEPADRYPDMGEVVAALLPFVTPAKPKTGPISAVKLPPIALAAVEESTADLSAALTETDLPRGGRRWVRWVASTWRRWTGVKQSR